MDSITTVASVGGEPTAAIDGAAGEAVMVEQNFQCGYCHLLLNTMEAIQHHIVAEHHLPWFNIHSVWPDAANGWNRIWMNIDINRFCTLIVQVTFIWLLSENKMQQLPVLVWFQCILKAYSVCRKFCLYCLCVIVKVTFIWLLSENKMQQLPVLDDFNTF